MTGSVERLPCPDFEDHTPAPEGYIAWHDWADEMSKTHRPRKCAGCGLYSIWEPRSARPPIPAGGSNPPQC